MLVVKLVSRNFHSTSTKKNMFVAITSAPANKLTKSDAA